MKHMKLAKFYWLTVTALLMLWAGSAAAWPDVRWTNGGGDGLWVTPENWENLRIGGNGPPGAGDADVQIPGGFIVTIRDSDSVTFGENTTYPTLFGPEWGSVLNIYGSLSIKWYIAPVGAVDNPSVINMYANSYYSGEGIALGHNWWWNGGPGAVLNMYGDPTTDPAYVDINWMWWGGKIYLYGGILSIRGGVTANTVDAVSDATRLIDIHGGWLVLPAGFETTVNDWIDRGIIKAYGGGGTLVITELGDFPGRTAVLALVPEPGTVTLIVLGLLAGIGLMRRRTA